MNVKLPSWMLLGWALLLIVQGCSRSPARDEGQISITLASLLTKATNEVAHLDIAHMNLLCAAGLTGCERVDVSDSLAVLGEMAVRVEAETKRHHYRYERNPTEFENSRGFYKVLMLGVVLAEDFKVHYCKDRQVSPGLASPNDGFFADARNVFLPGLLGEQRQGTCSSMPVLYVAVGRRLGYPLKLVTTKGHLFVRWEGAGERFNLEVTGNGLNRFADEYYRQWPFAVSDAEVASERYLQSLSPMGELAVALSIRAMCLRETGRMESAADVFDAAVKLAPEVRSYRVMAEQCRRVGRGKRLLTQAAVEPK